MKKFYSFALAALAISAVFSSCEKPVEPAEPTADPEGTTYERVHLIEHFTGEACGYCPLGMDYIYEEYSQQPEKMVWVSNHYGYGSDEYSIAGSTTIGKKLGVTSAPSISLNRYTYTNKSEGISKAKSYHPYYISDVLAKQEDVATSCISLSRTFDAASGLLHVVATIKTSDPTLEGVMLTLGVTESGPVGKQQDYVSSWEGWNEFTHTHVIRTYATAALGDEVLFTDRLAKAEFDIDINSKWEADNCEIVAWMTALGTNLPVLNAAKLPVVDGTQGGEDIKHGGITEVPVSATYPESGAPTTDTIRLSVGAASYYSYTEGTFIGVTLYDLNTSYGTIPGYSTYKLYPYLTFYIYQEANKTTLDPGVYNIVDAQSAAFGDVIAGERNDEEHELEYSVFYYVYQNGSSLGAYSQWLMRSGTITVNEDGSIAIVATSLNGSSIKAVYSGDALVPTKGASSAPRRAKGAFVKSEGMPVGPVLCDKVIR